MQKLLFELENINILPFEGEAVFYPDFLPSDERETYYNKLLTEISWQQKYIKIYDKEVLLPRLTAFYGDPDIDLTYSNINMKPLPWTETLVELKQKVEKIAEVKFICALLNLYRDGKDSVSWHRDNEKLLGISPAIASVSLGTTRTFQLRNFRNKKIVRSIELTPGSLLLMRGDIQRCWEHRIPKTNRRVGIRINATFRTVV